MYRFTVHGVQRSKSQPSLWAPTVYTFGNVDKETCQMWMNRLNTYLSMETDRPKNLLVCSFFGCSDLCFVTDYTNIATSSPNK